MPHIPYWGLQLAVVLGVTTTLFAQPTHSIKPPQLERSPFNAQRGDNIPGPPGFGPPNGGPPPFGMGGPRDHGPGDRGGPGGEEQKLVKQFDANDNGWLDDTERKSARSSISNNESARRSPRRSSRGSLQPKKGKRLQPENIASYPDASLYEPTVLRTLFFEFENKDWEQELADFKQTDVEVPATLTVDGKSYANVGVSFRGMSSYHMVPDGFKRSLNVSIDMANDDQRLYGYKTLNLLNNNGDPSFLRTVLAFKIAEDIGLPAPKANVVRVVINGESWGLYTNAQQFNKEFVAEHFPQSNASRWKVSGSPGGGGRGLEYLGEDVDAYEQRYELKSKDSKEAWPALIKLCEALDQTPPSQLEETLAPQMDIDEVLKFLAWDVALVNEDGYWTRASDYSLVRNGDLFSVIPHDANETFHEGRGPGGFGPPGFGPPSFGPRGMRPPGNTPVPPNQFDGQRSPNARNNLPPIPRPENGAEVPERDRTRAFGPNRRGPGGQFDPRRPGGPGSQMAQMGPNLDPLIAIDDDSKPLRHRLLAVPSLKTKYLSHMHDIAKYSLNWEQLGPFVEQYVALIKDDVKADTRKLSTYEAFLQATGSKQAPATQTGRPVTNLKRFIEQRREFLLTHPKVREAYEVANP